MPSLLITLLIWTIAIPAIVIGGLLTAARWRERHAMPAMRVRLLRPPLEQGLVRRRIAVTRRTAGQRRANTGCESARRRSPSR